MDKLDARSAYRQLAAISWHEQLLTRLVVCGVSAPKVMERFELLVFSF